MEMCLGEIPVHTIMLIGRWSSDAFLRYIQKQVEQFSRNVANKMLTFQYFRHIPDITPQQISSEDPPRRGEILDATNTSVLPVLLFGGPDDAIQLMEEHLFPTAEGVGEGSPKARRGEN